MAFYQIKTELFFTQNVEELWEFISDPSNLSNITPADMALHVLSDQTGEMYPGMIIEYSVRPLLGIKTKWVTEITQVEEGKYFVDEQRIGPYKMWHHEHRLEPKDGGVIMKDIVSYQLPYGILGRIAHALFIKKKLSNVFAYRERVLHEIFNS